MEKVGRSRAWPLTTGARLCCGEASRLRPSKRPAICLKLAEACFLLHSSSVNLYKPRMSIDEDLRGKVVLVTGGANRIGAATVRALHGQRAHVHFCDVDVKAGV